MDKIVRKLLRIAKELYSVKHYKYKRPRVTNDLASQWSDYLDYGEFTKRSIQLVPIDKVDFEPWNEGRYDNVVAKMEGNKALDPVDLHKRSNGRYMVNDGNHRTAVSKKMGYTHVPAVVSEVIKGKPSKEPPPALKKELMEREALALSHVLRRELWKLQVEASWRKTGKDNYTYFISFWDLNLDSTDYPLKVTDKGDFNEVDFSYKGNNYRKKIRKDQFLSKFPEDFRDWLKRII